jgi:hypothetical protein
MKRTLLLLLFGLLVSLPNYTAWGQTITKKDKKIYFYVFGWLGGRYQSEDSCVVLMRNAFGFDYIDKAADIYTDSQRRRWVRHNKRVESKLRHRWGDDWEEKLKLRISSCKGK